MAQHDISFAVPRRDREIISAIARRAQAAYRAAGVRRTMVDIAMDVTATHCNGNPLRLADLLAAPDFTFMHDIGGIYRCLDRSSGKLNHHFRPRCSAPERANAEAA